MKITYLVLTLPLVLASNYVLAENCEDSSTSMAEVRSCVINQENQVLDKQLKKTIEIIKSKHPELLAPLNVAQESWKEFMRNSCDLTAKINIANDSGYNENDERFSCELTFIRARVGILKSYQEDVSKIK